MFCFILLCHLRASANGNGRTDCINNESPKMRCKTALRNEKTTHSQRQEAVYKTK